MKNKFGIFAIINNCDFELKSTHDTLEDAVDELKYFWYKDGMYFIMPIIIKDDEAKREKENDNLDEFKKQLQRLSNENTVRLSSTFTAISLSSIRENLKKHKIK